LLAVFRPRAIGMAEQDVVDNPPGGTKLVIDQDAGGGFVQFDLVSLPGGEFSEQVKLLGRCGLGSTLSILEGGFRRVEARFRLGGVLFPEGLFLLSFLGLLERGQSGGLVASVNVV
jgi:hypothetical protein